MVILLKMASVINPLEIVKWTAYPEKARELAEQIPNQSTHANQRLLNSNFTKLSHLLCFVGAQMCSRFFFQGSQSFLQEILKFLFFHVTGSSASCVRRKAELTAGQVAQRNMRGLWALALFPPVPVIQALPSSQVLGIGTLLGALLTGRDVERSRQREGRAGEPLRALGMTPLPRAGASVLPRKHFLRSHHHSCLSWTNFGRYELETGHFYSLLEWDPYCCFWNIIDDVFLAYGAGGCISLVGLQRLIQSIFLANTDEVLRPGLAPWRGTE